MIIKSIELNNFRVYYGYNSIDLAPNSDQNLVIVSGRNGFGKTTFLMSLVWCLYGRNMMEVDDVYRREIQEQGTYNKWLPDSLNQFAKKKNDFNFSVSVTFGNLNIPEILCKEITVTRSFNTKTSDRELVEVLIDGKPNELAQEVGPEIFIRQFIMPIEIAKFFFFDAEKIVSLAESGSEVQRKKLSDAYSEVLGIKKYEDLKDELEELQYRLREASASEYQKAELAEREGESNSLQHKIDGHERKNKIDSELIDSKRFEANQISLKLIQSGNTITNEELAELRSNVVKLESELARHQEDLKQSYDLMPFAIAGETMLLAMNQIQVESAIKKRRFSIEDAEAKTNSFLTDLLNADKPKGVLIDYIIQEHYNQVVRKLINKHFFPEVDQGEEESLQIHEFSDLEERELFTLINNLKTSFATHLRKLTSEYNYSKNELTRIRKKLRDAESQEASDAIRHLRSQRDKLDSEIHLIEEEISSRHQEIGVWKDKKTQLAREIDELKRRLHVSEKNREKDDLVTREIGRLDKFITQFKAQKKASLEREIMNGLKRLMHKQDFAHEVRVDIISDSVDIQLYDNDGNEIQKSAMSKGEQQMYATALLWALVEESDIEFPVFIDSPMQKFDDGHAERIVTEFYPNISEQVVIFPLINKELNRDEYELIVDRVAKTYLIINDDRIRSHFEGVEPRRLFEIYKEKYGNAV